MTASEEESGKRDASWQLYLEELFPRHSFRSARPDPNFGANSDLKELFSDGAPTNKKNIAASKLYGSARSPLWPQAYEQLPAYLERLERVLIRLLQQIDVLPGLPTDTAKFELFVVETFRRGHSSDKKYWTPLNALAGLGLARVMDLRQSMSESSVDMEDAVRAGMQISEIIHRLISSFHAMPAQHQRSLQAAKKEEPKEDQFIRCWLNEARLSPVDVQCKRRSRDDSRGDFRGDLRDDFRREFPNAPEQKFSRCLQRVTERWNVA